MIIQHVMVCPQCPHQCFITSSLIVSQLSSPHHCQVSIREENTLSMQLNHKLRRIMACTAQLCIWTILWLVIVSGEERRVRLMITAGDCQQSMRLYPGHHWRHSIDERRACVTRDTGGWPWCWSCCHAAPLSWPSSSAGDTSQEIFREMRQSSLKAKPLLYRQPTSLPQLQSWVVNKLLFNLMKVYFYHNKWRTCLPMKH